MLCLYGFFILCGDNPSCLGRVDIYVGRVLNSLISPYRRGEVPSPNGLGNPTPIGIDPM